MTYRKQPNIECTDEATIIGSHSYIIPSPKIKNKYVWHVTNI